LSYIGIDIGGTKCAVVLGEAREGRPAVWEKRVLPTPAFPGPERMLPALMEQIDGMLSRGEIAGIGISCGGPLDSAGGVILSPPNLPGWDGVRISEILRERYRAPVLLENDANACALAEWKYGAGQGCRDFVFFTFGTGNGAGLILNGALYRGASDMAGEAGHWRLAEYGPVGYGKSGSLEGFCSGGGIAQLARQRILERLQMAGSHPFADSGGVTAQEVFSLARQGDPLALELCELAGMQFGRALALLIDLLNPQAIVAGGIFTRNYDLLHPIAWRVVERECLASSVRACRLLPSRLGEEIGDIAALSVALQAQNQRRRTGG